MLLWFFWSIWQVGITFFCSLFWLVPLSWISSMIWKIISFLKGENKGIDDDMTIVKIDNQNINYEFSNESPLVVTKIPQNTITSEESVQIGSYLCFVNSTDVSKKNLHELKEILQNERKKKNPILLKFRNPTEAEQGFREVSTSFSSSLAEITNDQSQFSSESELSTHKRDNTKKKTKKLTEPTTSDFVSLEKPITTTTTTTTSSSTKFTSNVTLESIRSELSQFAKDRDWEQYHQPRNLVIAMVGEVGEVAECFQWRSDTECGTSLPKWSESDKNHLAEELSDVLSYLIMTADACGIDLADEVQKKIVKNAQKYPVSKAKGSNKKYTEF